MCFTQSTLNYFYNLLSQSIFSILFYYSKIYITNNLPFDLIKYAEEDIVYNGNIVQPFPAQVNSFNVGHFKHQKVFVHGEVMLQNIQNLVQIYSPGYICM